MRIEVNKVKMVIRNVVLGSSGEYGFTNISLAVNIKRLYFQLTGVEMNEVQSDFIDNLGNSKAIKVYKALASL